MGKQRKIPFGYTVRNGRIVIDPAEASQIRRIFSDYIVGASMQEIADDLTEKGVPFTIKCCEWNKTRVMRILENARYTGYEDFDPIIDEETFALAAECKRARNLRTDVGISEEIRTIAPYVKCECCGHPMSRFITNNSLERISWVCQNKECGMEIRIGDNDLIERIRILMNRVIHNAGLMIPKEKESKTPGPKVSAIKEDITKELQSNSPSETLVLSYINSIIAEEYKENCGKEAIEAMFAKQRVDIMKPQLNFNETYFKDMVKTVLICKDGSVRIITKTEAEIE